MLGSKELLIPWPHFNNSGGNPATIVMVDITYSGTPHMMNKVTDDGYCRKVPLLMSKLSHMMKS